MKHEQGSDKPYKSYVSVLDWAVNERGMRLGEPTAADAQREMNEHLDKVLGVTRPEAVPSEKRSKRGLAVARKVGMVVLGALLTAGAVKLGQAMYEASGRDRMFNPNVPEYIIDDDGTVLPPYDEIVRKRLAEQREATN